MINEAILTDVRNYLSERSKGREARAERIAAAGVPMDREAMQKWLTIAARDNAAENGYWFRGWSARTANGVDRDLPTFGKFGCRIDCAKPVIEEIDEAAGQYSFRFLGHLGISGAAYDTEAEAMGAATATLRKNGYVTDWRLAAEVAKSQAQERHEAQQKRAAKTAKIRRNADGNQSIIDLRKRLASRDDLAVEQNNGNWAIKSLIDNTWHFTSCPFDWSERQAIQSALFGSPESPQEAKYHADKM